MSNHSSTIPWWCRRGYSESARSPFQGSCSDLMECTNPIRDLPPTISKATKPSGLVFRVVYATSSDTASQRMCFLLQPLPLKNPEHGPKLPVSLVPQPSSLDDTAVRGVFCRAASEWKSVCPDWSSVPILTHIVLLVAGDRTVNRNTAWALVGAPCPHPCCVYTGCPV